MNQINYFIIIAAFGSPQTSLVLRSLFAKILIPEATDRKPNSLIVVGPEYIANAVIQEAVPGIARIDLRRTQPATVVANAVECSIVVTVTARKT